MNLSVTPEVLKNIFEGQSEAQSLERPGCFLFNRVSTKQDAQETSLEQQEHDSFQYAQRQGLHVVFNFRVQETASKEEERHAFNQLIQILKSDLINVKHVVFKSADRSSRNRFDR